MKDKAIRLAFEQKVMDIVEHYRKNTIVGEVKFTVVDESSILYTMYSTYFLPDSLTEIRDLAIVVDRSNQNDSHLVISLCHELAHLENALQAVATGDRQTLDPTTWLQKLRVEIMADRKAAMIYGTSGAKSVVGHWLKDEMKNSIKNFNKAVSKRAMLESMWFFIIRYILNAIYRQEEYLAG